MRLTPSFLSLVLALTSVVPAFAGDEASFFSFNDARGAYLGVQLSDLDRDAARDLGLSGSSGVRIERVLDGVLNRIFFHVPAAGIVNIAGKGFDAVIVAGPVGG